MNENSNIRMLRRAVTVLALFGAAASTAYADAWSASWGIVQGDVAGGADDIVYWNDQPNLWGLWAEAEMYHMHPPLSHEYGIDEEVLDPLGDGVASIGPLATGDLAEVDWVQAGVAQSAQAPYVDISPTHDVYSAAHDEPASWSQAAGFGQHDNLFLLEFDGNDPPPTALATIHLTGNWNLEGDSEPDDNWWADWYTYVEVYETSTGDVLAWRDEYHRLDGPGYDSDTGEVQIEFQVELAYATAYSLRFWMDAESYAVAVPQPSAIVVLATCGLIAVRRRRCERTR